MQIFFFLYNLKVSQSYGFLLDFLLSCFSEGKNEDIMKVIHEYLDLAIHYDYPCVIVKYCVQQMMGGLQDTPQGTSFHFLVRKHPKVFSH